MPNKPKRETPVTAYFDEPVKKRLLRVAKKFPKLTMSRQIEECTVKGLPEIEARVGISTSK